MKRTKDYKEHVCKHCGKTYKPHASNQQYCHNPECKRWNRNRINREARKKPEKEIVCKICNKTFKTSRWKQQQCCNEECRELFVLMKKKEYYKNVLKPKYGYLSRGESYPQKYVFNMVQKLFPDLIWKYDDRSVLKNPNTGYPLELDIWCPQKCFAIEFDGEQHFSPKYGQKVFDYTCRLDSIKTQECYKRNITLFRIAYKDDWRNEKWIFQKLTEFLNGNC